MVDLLLFTCMFCCLVVWLLGWSLARFSQFFLFFFFFFFKKVLYYGMGFTFLLCDKNNLLSTYKLPRKKDRLPPPHQLTTQQQQQQQQQQQKQTSLLYTTLIDSFIGHFFIQPLALYLLLSLLPSSSPLLSPCSPLPPFHQLHFLFLGANFTNEFLFYWLHRVCHTFPILYQNIHKQHHEYKETIGFAAEYAHFWKGFVIIIIIYFVIILLLLVLIFFVLHFIGECFTNFFFIFFLFFFYYYYYFFFFYIFFFIYFFIF